MSPVAATLVILALAIAAFLSNRIPLGIVAIGVSLSLWFSGILDVGQALAGFGDPTVLFIASLFVVGEALDATGVTAWAGQQVLRRGGRRRGRLIVTVAALVAALTALISVNGAVAALIPVVVVVATRVGLPPSQMLMPLVFSAHAGALLALTGSPVNIIVSAAAQDAGARPFGFIEFGLVGVPLLVGTVTILVVLGRRLIPDRVPSMLPQDVGAQAQALRERYALPAGTELASARHGVTEVLVPPRSSLVGTHVFPGMVTASGDLVVLGAQRAGQDLSQGDDRLRPGDVVLLSGSWDHLSHHTRSEEEVVVVSDPEAMRRAVPLGRGARRTVVVLGAMVVLLATGAVPPAVAGLLAASALVLSGVLTPAQAHRSISWTTVLLIGGMLPLSTAFVTTGTADAISERLLTAVGDGSPRLALLAVCGLTMALSQVVSNTATVLIMAPIAVSVSVDLGVSVHTYLMAVAVSAVASFLTPVATPANAMILEPGGYRFADYWRLGSVLLALFLAVAVLYVPLIWPF